MPITVNQIYVFRRLMSVDLPVGHSLGAAVATLDATMLRMQLNSDVEVDSVVFGLPRVGNQQFANMVDAMVCPSYSH